MLAAQKPAQKSCQQSGPKSRALVSVHSSIGPGSEEGSTFQYVLYAGKARKESSQPKLTVKVQNLQVRLSQQRTLTKGGLKFKAANQSNQCLDFLNEFRKSSDVYGV